MRISLGLGALTAIQRSRLIRRGSVVLGVVASIFSFVTIDLARHDAIFSADIFVNQSMVPPTLDFTLINASDQAMVNLEARFAIYDRDGNRIRLKQEDGRWEALEDSAFGPIGMTIGPNKSKVGQILLTKLEKPVTEIGHIFVCSIFDGSFWVDKLRTEYAYVPTVPGSFGQKAHQTSVYYLTQPDCMPPEHFAPKG